MDNIYQPDYKICMEGFFKYRGKYPGDSWVGRNSIDIVSYPMGFMLVANHGINSIDISFRENFG